MNPPARVVLGLAPLEEEAIEEALYGRAGGLRVLASGADAGELIELAAERAPDLVLVSAGLPGLDARSLARLRALGSRVAGLALDERAAAQLAELDPDCVLRPPLEANLDDLLAAEVAQEREPPAAAVNAARGAETGSTVAVVGAKGAPGASELAASFAAVVARHYRALLVELDLDGGRLALRLEADPQQGSLPALARAVASGESALPSLARWVLERADGWPPVVLGPTDARDFPELDTPGLAERVLDALVARYALVVCDLGHRMAHGGTGDPAVRLHRDAARRVDAVIAVLGTRPEQVQAGLAQLDLLLELGVVPEALRVVVNGQPSVRLPRASPVAARIVSELAARGLGVDAWLPFDERALHAAARRRLPLALAGSRSPYARAVAELAASILLPSLPRPATRKRRLRPPQIGARERGARDEVVLPWRR